MEKEREIWYCGNLEICLDKVKNLGFFIEVEAKGNFRNPVEAKKVCYDFLSKLGVNTTKKNIINTGYPVLLLEHKIKSRKKH